jgi:squalene-hopene/tetraprenyl-beta-curcumene cyclase
MNRAGLLLIFATALGFCADWSPQLAARYLDSRQKEWFAWKPAASANGPCVSCHTGMTYLLARPALRRKLGESEPTSYESGLLDRLRAQAGSKPPANIQGVEVIFAALFLAQQDSGALSDATKLSFDQLWSLQRKDGGLHWYSANLDPWETEPSFFYGAALGALAVGSVPAQYRNQGRVKELVAYLQDGWQARPLHHRLALLWASSKLPEVLPARQPLIDEIWKAQQPDGGWTIESLGPWMAHPDATASEGSNGYATGFVAYVLQKAGVPRSHPSLVRALAWLKSHQDRESGAWPAKSMNKQYPPDSMPVRFLQDAATAFAALALVEAGQ